MTPQNAREEYGLRVRQYVRGRRNAASETHVKFVVTCPRSFVSVESPWVDATLAGTILYLTVTKAVQQRQQKEQK